MDLILAIALMVVFALVGAGGGYFYRKNMAEKRIGRTEEYAKKLLDDATRKAAETKKEMEIEAKEEVLRLKTKLDDEIRTRRAEMQRSERRVNQREEMLDKKMDNLEKREEAINQKSEQTQALYDEAEQLRDKQVKELERIAGMTQDEAEQMIISRVQKEAYHDAAAMVRDIEAKAKDEGEKKARNIIALAIQKCAADHVAETTVSVINLPNDDMKGRIIGREGRNIRALETATGVDLIIDDTPEAVIVSAFDPGAPRDCAHRPGEADSGWPHPPRPHRGNGGKGQEGSGQPDPARPANRPSSRRVSTASIPSWSSCWAACATAPAMARTCSSTPSRSAIWPA